MLWVERGLLAHKQWWTWGWGARGKIEKGALWWRHHSIILSQPR